MLFPWAPKNESPAVLSHLQQSDTHIQSHIAGNSKRVKFYIVKYQSPQVSVAPLYELYLFKSTCSYNMLVIHLCQASL